jgi:hypothetical protein
MGNEVAVPEDSASSSAAGAPGKEPEQPEQFLEKPPAELD